MAHEIIMPALGMAQDTGIIVAWHKNPGDAVRADDILAEVETDKTTMEIDVGHDGFLACVMAEAGVEVPVGNVIAIIAATAEEAGDIARDTPVSRAADRLPAAVAAPAPAAAAPALAPSPPPPVAIAPAGAAAVSGGRILASPKARRLARERGIDLRNLVAQGLPQPFHAADLDKVQTTNATAMVVAVDEFEAEIVSESFDTFHRWVETKAGTGVPAGRIWAAFAAACFREASGGAGAASLCVRVTSFGPDGEEAVVVDPDRSGLLNMIEAAEGAAADLVIFDLTRTSLSNYRAGGAGIVPALIVARTGDDSFKMTLQIAADRFPRDSAVEILSGVAARTGEPSLHLL